MVKGFVFFLSVILLFLIVAILFPYVAGVSLVCGKPKIYSGMLQYPKPDVRYDYCIRQYSVLHNDIKLCEKQYNGSCYFKISRQLKNKEVCNLVNEYKKDECNRAVGLAYKDTSFCHGVFQTSCRSDIAEYKRDPSVCNEIHEVGANFWCITAVAKFMNDQTICNEIDKSRLPENFTIETCYEAVTREKSDYYGGTVADIYGGELDAEFGLKQTFRDHLKNITRKHFFYILKNNVQ